jgi:hypothetical protein
VVTHTGNCGVCSSAKDLATYFDPDLASKHSNVGSIMFSFCKACLHSLKASLHHLQTPKKPRATTIVPQRC